MSDNRYYVKYAELPMDSTSRNSLNPHLRAIFDRPRTAWYA